MLLQRPAMRFLSGEEWAPVADLIYGPVGIHTDKFFNEDVRKRSRERLKALRKLWAELGSDIKQARDEYAPKMKLWGSRFDR